MSKQRYIVCDSDIEQAFGSFLELVPGAVGVKNEDSVYVGVNQASAELAGFSDPEQFVGLRDSDMLCEAAFQHLWIIR